MIKNIICNNDGTYTVIGYVDGESKTFEATSVYDAAEKYRDYCFGNDR